MGLRKSGQITREEALALLSPPDMVVDLDRKLCDFEVGDVVVMHEGPGPVWWKPWTWLRMQKLSRITHIDRDAGIIFFDGEAGEGTLVDPRDHPWVR